MPKAFDLTVLDHLMEVYDFCIYANTNRLQMGDIMSTIGFMI